MLKIIYTSKCRVEICNSLQEVYGKTSKGKEARGLGLGKRVLKSPDLYNPWEIMKQFVILMMQNVLSSNDYSSVN